MGQYVDQNFQLPTK